MLLTQIGIFCLADLDRELLWSQLKSAAPILLTQLH